MEAPTPLRDLQPGHPLKVQVYIFPIYFNRQTPKHMDLKWMSQTCHGGRVELEAELVSEIHIRIHSVTFSWTWNKVPVWYSDGTW